MRTTLATLEVRIPQRNDRIRAYAALAAAITVLAAEVVGIVHGLTRLFLR